jgi:hypothetical protein
MSSQVDELRSLLTRMHEQSEWAKQDKHHGMISMGFRLEALRKVAVAALDEHASHFSQYKDDRDGCATCFYLHELTK